MLRDIYLQALTQCEPQRLIRAVLRDDMPRDVVAIGKCAGALLDGIGEHARDAFVAVPAGYRLPVGVRRQSRRFQSGADAPHSEVAIGGHPDYTEASFEAGEQLLRFVDSHDDLLVIVSGGGSACVEVPAPGFSREQLTQENARLIASGLPISEINARRKQMSAIKGGKLAQRVRGRCVTLVYSDVSTGALGDVASGPTIPGSDDVHLIADNSTLVRAAAALMPHAHVIESQVEMDVEDAARLLVAQWKEHDEVIAGGETTVVKRGDGKGGRCIELAIRIALRAKNIDGEILCGSSDGVDGNSGVAGVAIRLPVTFDRAAAERELAGSNSLAVAEAIGEPIIIPQAGNNLRDLYLLARS